MRRLLFLPCVVVLIGNALAQHVLVKARNSIDTKHQQQSVTPYDLTSASAFLNFQRYPSEEKMWMVMSGVGVAYFRDVFVGGDTLLSGIYDGEQWYATATPPGSSPMQWFPVTYYISYNGMSNCFLGLAGYGPLCGSNQIEVLWYMEVQCAPTGTWRMNFFDNGVSFANQSFTLLPQIPPQWTTTSFNQGDPAWRSNGYDRECYRVDDIDEHPQWCGTDTPDEERQFTIGRKGCMITTLADIIDYHALPDYHVIAVDPDQMNTLLNVDVRGWSPGPGDVNPLAVGRVSSELNVPIHMIGYGFYDAASLEGAICRYGPQPMRVSHGGTPHWVMTTGRDAGRTTWLINDPNGGDITTLQKYGNQYYFNRIYSDPGYFYSDRSIVALQLFSPAAPLLIDPNGNQTGFDPVTNTTYNSIPNAGYDPQSGEEDIGFDISTPDVKELIALQPIDGTYNLKLTGTADGTYDLYFATADINGNPSGQMNLLKVPTYTGAVQEFEFAFQKAPAAGTTIQLSGGFDGGGQRPKDVNKFLSYSNPTASQTTLPAGVMSFPLMIFYSSTTIASTFSAQLNGMDVSSLFHPSAGTFETVPLLLQTGKNVLLLSIKGTVSSGREATDTDRLVITAQ